MTISMLFLIVALVLFIFGAFPPAAWSRVNLISLGLAFGMAAVLIAQGGLSLH